VYDWLPLDQYSPLLGYQRIWYKDKKSTKDTKVRVWLTPLDQYSPLLGYQRMWCKDEEPYKINVSIRQKFSYAWRKLPLLKGVNMNLQKRISIVKFLSLDKHVLYNNVYRRCNMSAWWKFFLRQEAPKMKEGTYLMQTSSLDDNAIYDLAYIMVNLQWRS
jgi:hypothetical protein